jgi:hypothetical protein
VTGIEAEEAFRILIIEQLSGNAGDQVTTCP